MIGIALRSLRARPAAMLVVLLVGCVAPLLLTAAGTLLATAIGLSAPPDRFTAPVVVAGSQGFKLPDQEHQRVAYPEGAVVPVEVTAKVTAVEGVDHVETYRDAGTDRAVAIGVWPTPGTGVDELADRLGSGLGDDEQVLTGDERGLAEDPGIRASRIPLVVLGAVTSGVMTAIVALVASSALALTINERRREIRLLRLVGATPKQVRRMVTIETAAVAVVAATAGALAAPAVSTAVVERLTTGGLLPPLLEPSGQRLVTLAAWVATIVVLTVSASVISGPAVRRATADDQPVADTRPTSPLRRSLALVVGGTAAAMVLATPFLGPEGGSSVGGPAVLVAAAAVGLAAPLLVRLGLPLLRRCTARIGLGSLGSDSIAGHAGRLGSVVTLLALGVSLAAGNIGAAFATARAETPSVVDASAYVDLSGTPNAGDSPDTSDSVDRVAQVAGPDAVVSCAANSTGWIESPYDGTGSDPVTLTGVDRADRFVDGKVSAGSLADLTGASIAITKHDADDLRLGVGDQLTYRFGDGGSERLRVVAVLDLGRGDRARVVPYQLIESHVRSAGTTIVVDGPGARDRLEQAGFTVSTTATAPTGVLDSLGPLIYLAVGVAALVFATVVAVNSLAAFMLSRRAELWSWRLVGATRRQLRSALVVEAGYVGLLSVLVGGLIGAVDALSIAIGLGHIPALPWVLGAILVGPLALVLLTALTAGARATRPPATA